MTYLRYMFAVAVVFIGLGNANAFDGPADYRMGPQDKLKVRVYDWRLGTYDTHEWPALTGEFTVGASGRVSFPIVGEVLADGKTTAELAGAIAAGLRDKVGLAQVPFAAVEIIRYRPFYILGAIAKPGEYPYRPGLTALQAIGVGGGLERPNETFLIGLEREAMSSQGEIRALEAERRQLTARQARIKAELDDLPKPDWSTASADESDEVWAAVVRGEETLLAGHRQAARTQEGSVAQTKRLLEQQLSSLGAKSSVLKVQEDLAQYELTLVDGLVSRGLAGTPRQIALQQSQAQLRGNRIDVDLATVRTQQEIIRNDRDLAEFRSKARAQLLQEDGDLRLRLATSAEKISALRSLFDHAVSRVPMSAVSDRSRLVTTISVAREIDGQVAYVPIAEGYLLKPGETIQVEQHREKTQVLQSLNR